MLLFAGDITFFSRRASVLADFNSWLGDLPHRHKIVIPGNHDRSLLDPANQKSITNAHLLINGGVEIEGLKIWGSPVTQYVDTPFGIGTSEEREKHWARIPPDLDVLITHGPPYRILDKAPGCEHYQGDKELFQAISRSPPAVHVFGHVHGAYGTHELMGTLFVNAALAGPDGDLDKQPIQIKMERMKGN